MKLAFVCVRNAGRSQMAHAFAQREARERGVDVDLLTGGTDPADHVHENVVETMRAVGVDLVDREPREVTPEELADADIVVTMGCSAAGVCPAAWQGESRDWDLDDPHGKGPEETRRIRDEVERRVAGLFDELESELGDE